VPLLSPIFFRHFRRRRQQLSHDIAECMSASGRVYAILIKSLVAGRRADGERGIALSSSFNLAARTRLSGKSTHIRTRRRRRNDGRGWSCWSATTRCGRSRVCPTPSRRKTLECHPFSRANNLKYLRCRTLKWSANFDSNAIRGNFFSGQLYFLKEKA
jgi:hypothetical protein